MFEYDCEYGLTQYIVYAHVAFFERDVTGIRVYLNKGHFQVSISKLDGHADRFLRGFKEFLEYQ